MTQPVTFAHQDFIKDTVPSWFVYTTQPLREGLRKEMVRGQHLRAQLAKTLGKISRLDQFAKALLVPALDKAFGPGLDIERDILRNRLPARTHGTTEGMKYSLLEAALHNFHEEDLDASRTESTIFYHEGDRQVSPVKFMELCRHLDIGGQYQAHLSQVLDTEGGRSFKELLGHQALNALRAEAHIAFMNKQIPSPVFNALMALSINSKPATADLHLSTLTLLDARLRDILVFQRPGQTACTVYMPAEPSAPLREYASLDAFMAQLREKLRQPEYLAYFSRFIARRSMTAFRSRLEDCLTPKRKHIMAGDENQLIPRYYLQREADPNADLRLELETGVYTFVEHVYFYSMLRIKDDARTLAVPTGDEDAESRRARIAGYISLGMNVANVAAFFVPVLGEVMMGFAAGQLLAQTFEGVADWLHGDLDDALGHLCSVAENIAFMAALAAAGKFGAPGDIPAIHESAFVGKLIPVKLGDGQTRLWSPDLTPFATDVRLPEGVRPTAEGVFSHEGDDYIALEERFYRVEHDLALNKWRLKPTGSRRFVPELAHNGEGAWRHTGESPAQWDVHTCFRRLGYRVSALDEMAAEQVMAVSGTDKSLLAVLHLDSQAPPAGLTDAIERFALDRQVSTFVELINDGSRFESADPRLQLKLLPSIRGWPRDRMVYVPDDVQTSAAG